jgi:PAS domain S-box-containing protein
MKLPPSPPRAPEGFAGPREPGYDADPPLYRACFEELLDSVPVAVLVLDSAERVVRANPEFTRIFGFSADAVVGRRDDELIVPEFLREQAAEQRHAAWRGARVSAETICRRSDGSLLDVHLQRVAVPGRGAERAQLVLYRDVSDGRRRAAGQGAVEPSTRSPDLPGLPATLEAMLHAEPTAEGALVRLARALVPGQADFAIVYLRGPGGDLRRAAVASADPEQAELLAEQLQRYPLSEHPPIPPVARALERGEPQLLPDVSIGALKALPGDREHVSIALLLGLVSLLVVPLEADGRVLGALSLATAESGRRFGPEHLALTAEIARRTAAVLVRDGA